MDFSLDLLLQGFASALTPTNLVFALFGSLVGTLVGVLPGIGPTAAIAMLLPLALKIPQTPGLIMMAAIYYGAMYGGSTTAIVVNIPGEASSVPTAMDGYQLTKQGRAGPTLGISAISSFVAGTISLLGLTLFAPLLASVALMFGPPEYFALMFMALSLVVGLSGRSLLKGLLATAFGLLIMMVGQDPLSGATRFTFGSIQLMAGVNFIAVIVGLFAVGEVLVNVEKELKSIYAEKITSFLPTWEDVRYTWPAMIRSSVIGFFLGLLPGCPPSVTVWVAYDVEKRASKHPERFGKGAIDAVAAVEGCNNATVSGGFVPLFAFGLPAAPALAVLLGAFMMFKLQPGPMLFKENPQLVWAIIASMYVGNLLLLVLNLPLVGIWARIAQIPFGILGPLILIFSIIGAYTVRFSMFDVWVALVFGVIGYLMRKLSIPLAPLVLATVLAQMLETNLQQSLILSHGSPLIFFNRPISAVFMILAIVTVARGLWLLWRERAPDVDLETGEA